MDSPRGSASGAALEPDLPFLVLAALEAELLLLEASSAQTHSQQRAREREKKGVRRQLCLMNIAAVVV
jgi:hypothetical protein